MKMYATSSTSLYINNFPTLYVTTGSLALCWTWGFYLISVSMPDLRFYFQRQWDKKRMKILWELPENLPLQSWLKSKPHFTRRPMLWTPLLTNSANISTQALITFDISKTKPLLLILSNKEWLIKCIVQRLSCQKVLNWKRHWKESKCLPIFFDLLIKNCVHFHWFVNIYVITISKYYV